MNRRQFAALLPLALAIGCEAEPEPAMPATPPDPEKVRKAIEDLGARIGNLEDEVDGLIHGDWSKFVPKVEATSGDIRIAYEHLRQALGMHTA